MVMLKVGGDIVEGVRIGKGNYSVAYLTENGRVVLYSDDDCSKELLAKLSDSVTNKHIPRVKSHGHVIVNRRGVPYKLGVYSMPFYKNAEKSDGKAYDVAVELVREYERFMKTREFLHLWKTYSGPASMKLFIRRIRGNSRIPESVMEALSYIARYSVWCGYDVWFDIRKRNLGVDKRGNLILRDIFYGVRY